MRVALRTIAISGVAWAIAAAPLSAQSGAGSGSAEPAALTRAPERYGASDRRELELAPRATTGGASELAPRTTRRCRHCSKRGSSRRGRCQCGSQRRRERRRPEQGVGANAQYRNRRRTPAPRPACNAGLAPGTNAAVSGGTALGTGGAMRQLGANANANANATDGERPRRPVAFPPAQRRMVVLDAAEHLDVSPRRPLDRVQLGQLHLSARLEQWRRVSRATARNQTTTATVGPTSEATAVRSATITAATTATATTTATAIVTAAATAATAGTATAINTAHGNHGGAYVDPGYRAGANVGAAIGGAIDGGGGQGANIGAAIGGALGSGR